MLTGGIIRAARALAGCSQDQLAAAAGISARTLRRWEDAPGPIACRRSAEARVVVALAEAGVLTFSQPTPGVRLVPTQEQSP